MTAQKGRTYDRTAPSGETSEKALASGAVPHMALRVLSCFEVCSAAQVLGAAGFARISAQARATSESAVLLPGMVAKVLICTDGSTDNFSSQTAAPPRVWRGCRASWLLSRRSSRPATQQPPRSCCCTRATTWTTHPCSRGIRSKSDQSQSTAQASASKSTLLRCQRCRGMPHAR